MFKYASLVPLAIDWHGHSALLWTIVVAGVIIFFSYTTLCATLLYLVRRTRRILQTEWTFLLTGFAMFLLVCGLGRLLDVITIWVHTLRWAAAARALTAVISAFVAVYFLRRVNRMVYSAKDYAARLADAESEANWMEASLLAAQRLEEWGRISATVSHEIANPLETVQNLLYLIRSTPGIPREAAEHAMLASIEADRTMTIARSALDFLRQSPVPRPVDLREAAESLRLLLDRQLREKQVVLEIFALGGEGQSSSNFIVEAYPGEARQVLLNLARNAADATPRRSRIRVGLISMATGVEVTVADAGTGVDPAILPTLFQFGVSTKSESGSGIGLWSVKHIVTRHGGTIQVDSRPGEGTYFTLHWPRRFSGEPSAI